MNSYPRFWAVVPAAGVGSRMGAAIPKQYLPLHGKTVIEQTLARLALHRRISGVAVSISNTDAHWPHLDLDEFHTIIQAAGGAERCHSVLNGLTALGAYADDDDWVLVHDAARPCIHPNDIDRLIDGLNSHDVGGLLGLPVADTVKRCSAEADVLETVPRDYLWRALTPQMFRLGQLRDALETALSDGFLVTDEASAIEHMGLQPKIIEGRADNIKITRPDDLSLAAMYLAQQEKE